MQCQALTKNGEQCKNTVKKGCNKHMCWIHKGTEIKGNSSYRLLEEKVSVSNLNEAKFSNSAKNGKRSSRIEQSNVVIEEVTDLIRKK